jgi:hypothetical protein
MELTLLLPVVKVVGGIAALYVAWWLLGDFVLDHVGIPFVDAVVWICGEDGRFEVIDDDHAGRERHRAARHVPSSPVRVAREPSRAAQAGLSRRTGMSRLVRA